MDFVDESGEQFIIHILPQIGLLKKSVNWYLISIVLNQNHLEHMISKFYPDYVPDRLMQGTICKADP